MARRSQKRTPDPHVIVLAGPNGAGKSTASSALLRDELGVKEFVNADVIARGLSGFSPDGAAVEAGRLMLERVHDLAHRRINFAFETTLASRSFAPWLHEILQTGFRFQLLFFWLPTADMAIRRVAERVRAGGHHVPEDTIRRRYERGLRNFFELYQPISTTWRFLDSSSEVGPVLIASGSGPTIAHIGRPIEWMQLRREYGNEIER